MNLKAGKYRFSVVLMSAGNTVKVDLSAVAGNRTEAYQMVRELPSILWKSRGVDVGISALNNPRMEDCYFEGDDIPLSRYGDQLDLQPRRLIGWGGLF